MFFRKNKGKTTKKIDKLVTGLIIGGAVAGMIGFSQTKKGKEITKDVQNSSKNFGTKTKKFFGKTILKTIKIFKKFKND